jgi:hypothetical protein
MKKLTALIVFGIYCTWLLAGCGKPASVPSKTTADSSTLSVSNALTSEVVSPQVSGPKEGVKICFACNGTGTIKCVAPGCVNGMVDCPGPCLKLDRGVWIHMDVPGHPPTDVWQKFNEPDGSYAAYSQNHVGHVIAMQNGKAVDTGPCAICGGSGKVPCKVCKGTGRVTCPICEGQKFIPVAWTPTNNPWLDKQPDLIRLASGQVMFGKIMHSNDTELTIKTRDGRWIHVAVTNILPNPEVPNVTTP